MSGGPIRFRSGCVEGMPGTLGRGKEMGFCDFPIPVVIIGSPYLERIFRIRAFMQLASCHLKKKNNDSQFEVFINLLITINPLLLPRRIINSQVQKLSREGIPSRLCRSPSRYRASVCTEQSKASAATILTTPLLTQRRKTQGKPSQRLLMRVLFIKKLEHA